MRGGGGCWSLQDQVNNRSYNVLQLHIKVRVQFHFTHSCMLFLEHKHRVSVIGSFCVPDVSVCARFISWRRV